MIWKTFFLFCMAKFRVCFFACVKYRQLHYVTITMVIHNFCFNLPPESFLIFTHYSRVLFFHSPSIARILREEGINLDRSFVVYEFFSAFENLGISEFFFSPIHQLKGILNCL